MSFSEREIDELKRENKAKCYLIPFPVKNHKADRLETFVEIFNQQQELLINEGIFIELQLSDKGFEILVISRQHELALFLVGVAWGSYDS